MFIWFLWSNYDKSYLWLCMCWKHHVVVVWTIVSSYMNHIKNTCLDACVQTCLCMCVCVCVSFIVNESFFLICSSADVNVTILEWPNSWLQNILLELHVNSSQLTNKTKHSAWFKPTDKANMMRVIPRTSIPLTYLIIVPKHNAMCNTIMCFQKSTYSMDLQNNN